MWYSKNYNPASLTQYFINNLQNLYESGNKAGLSAHYSRQLKRYDPDTGPDQLLNITGLEIGPGKLQAGEDGSSYYVCACKNGKGKAEEIIVFKEYGELVFAYKAAFEEYKDQLMIDVID